MKKLDDSIAVATIKKVVINKGFKWFDNGSKYDLNIVGIRSKDFVLDSFNDLITVSFFDGSGWVCKQYVATVDAGLYYYEHPINKEGTASLIEGQYLGAFGLGLHKGQYSCLVQIKPLTVNRNSLAQGFPIMGSSDFGFFAIEIHHAAVNSVVDVVGRYSAGCQVINNIDDFDEFMSIINKTKQVGYVPKFTYTLINEKDIDNVKQQVNV